MHFGETIMLAMPVSGFVPASRLLRFCASTALAGCIAFPALAQTATATKEDEDTEEVMVVTGSRVVVDNAKAPTPVTIATVEQLQLAAPRTITEGLLQLPIFAGSVSVANQSTGTTGSNGAANLNLRGLGTSRTLVLLDSRRFVPASSSGAVDVALLPEALISQVEVVTGGASAAYGSDAVGGVVNFRLNTKFEGFKGDASSGVSGQGDNEYFKLTLAAGKSFLDNKLNVIGSVEYYDSAGIGQAQQRDWTARGRGIITNPNVTAQNPASPTNPTRLVVVNPLAANASLGGLVTNTALAGTTFDFVNGVSTPRAFRFGTPRTATQMAGSTDPNAYNPNLLLVLQPAQARAVGFLHIEYEVSSNLTIYAEGNLARNDVHYASLPTFQLGNTAFPIFQDNAYLPAATRAAMTGGNITQFTLGRVSPDMATPTMDGRSDTKRVVFGLDGKFGFSDWTYNAYFQHGQNRSLFKTSDNPISNNLYRAADAVVAQAGNAAGVPTGTIICRSTLLVPSDGCVPVNIFGNGAPSAAALRYITGTAVQDVTVKQDVFETSMQGSIFDLPGGAVKVAAGVGWRKESFVQITDPISSSIRTGAGIQGFPTGLRNTLGGFERSNPQPAKGGVTVKEAFGEVNLPVFEGETFAETLSFNGAIRYTDYSNSGGVTTWKVGGVYSPIRDIRFRATRSRDIRAPNLAELYRGSSQGTATVTDPFRNNASRNALTGNIGNLDLTPEIANTTVIGVVLQPSFVPGFTFSADWYKIDIEDAISALTPQRTVDLCFQGATNLCRFLQRGADGELARIELPFFNVDLRSTKGIDFEANYRTSIGSADINLRSIFNYVITLQNQIPGGLPLELAGDIGNSTPKWQGVVSANVDFGRYGVFLQGRYIGPGNFDKSFAAKDIDINYQKAVFYTDLTLNMDLDSKERFKAFVTVNNIFDQDPPQTPSFLIAGSSFGNRTLYDQIGRMFSAGVRFNF